MGGHRQTLLAMRLLVLAALCWGQARGVAMTLEDLDKFAELFAGKFDNKIQREKDVKEGGKVHTLVNAFQVPIEVLAMRFTGPNGHLVSRQFYVEYFVSDNVIPSSQEILNFILKQNHIAMETYEHPNPQPNAAAKLEWRMWADDRLVFENLRVEDLSHNPFCDVRWTKAADGAFVGIINKKNCTSGGDTDVYSEITVKLTASTMVNDIRYMNFNDDTVATKLNQTSFIFNRIGDIPPFRPAGRGAGYTAAPGAGSTLSTCHLVSMVMCWAIGVAISAF